MIVIFAVVIVFLYVCSTVCSFECYTHRERNQTEWTCNMNVWECAKNSVDVTAILQRIPLQSPAKFSAAELRKFENSWLYNRQWKWSTKTKQIQVQKKNGNGFKNERNLIFVCVCACLFVQQTKWRSSNRFVAIVTFFVRLFFLLQSAEPKKKHMEKLREKFTFENKNQVYKNRRKK